MQAATKAGGMALSEVDVCKTQVGDAVVPIPYPNTAELNKAEGVSTKVKIVDHEAVTLASSVPSSITGPAPGLIGGVISNTLNGKCKFIAGSLKVNIEGHPAIRLNDPTTQNKKNCEGSVAVPSQLKVIING
ncbi:DUF4150 domain-containing protein [Desulfovibrio inopinatus]|uniref:DUF4150 domain-containing protein n=1 Tax=Desulfovibrio inopinatus TaxID=102109 RepID=UPI000426169E|nr:DUF4150 domain-containing protein [Desulfovibrio inopinatus]